MTDIVRLVITATVTIDTDAIRERVQRGELLATMTNAGPVIVARPGALQGLTERVEWIATREEA